ASHIVSGTIYLMANCLSWWYALACLLLGSSALAHSTGGNATVRHRSIADSSSTISRYVIEAEKALDQKDYARAKKLALAATIASPQDSRAWFDLGLAERGVEEIPAAIGALRRAVALKSDFFEANLD